MITRFLVGTYTSERGKPERKEGLFAFRFDTETGKLRQVNASAAGVSPSFVRIHPNGQYVYVVNEGGKGGVTALRLDAKSGSAEMINAQPSFGIAPCYIALDPTAHFALTANYGTGNLLVYPIREDGGLGEKSSMIQHAGSGPNKGRQEGPHAHSIQFDASGKYAIAADLGLDRVMAYKLSAKGDLALGDLWGAAMKPGAGPRHTAMHPDGKTIYVANELDSTITVCCWDSAKGILCPVQNLSTLDKNFKERSDVADVHITPDGRFVYVSNRGADDLAGYAIQADGTLNPIGNFDCGGKWPRNFAITPDGGWVICAGQYSNSLSVLRIDGSTGGLTLTDEQAVVPSPVCVELVPPAIAGKFDW